MLNKHTSGLSILSFRETSVNVISTLSDADARVLTKQAISVRTSIYSITAGPVNIPRKCLGKVGPVWVALHAVCEDSSLAPSRLEHRTGKPGILVPVVVCYIGLRGLIREDCANVGLLIGYALPTRNSVIQGKRCSSRNLKTYV